MRLTIKIAALALLAAPLLPAQRRSAEARIDVEKYTIDARIDPEAQTLTAKVKMDFTALEEAGELTLGLNPAFDLRSITDGQGSRVSAGRGQDSTIRLLFAEPLAKGKPASLTFDYAGRLTGNEDSPVWGIRFASIQRDFAYLMYPSLWFPVHDYTVDRFAMDLRVSVPAGFRVAASGDSAPAPASTVPGEEVYRYEFRQPSFPGSFAVTRGDPMDVTGGPLTATFYFRNSSNMANAYGQEMGKALDFFTGLFGPPPSRRIAVVETEAGAPNGYSAPGIIFLSPGAIGTQVNTRVVANQIARQWWGGIVSPASRNHLWITNGMARYAELLYAEANEGKGVFIQCCAKRSLRR